MKLILRYCLPWGSITTQVFEVDPAADVDVLYELIAKKLNVPKSKQTLKSKNDGKIFKLTPGFSFEHFGIKEKSIVFLEGSDPLNEEDINQLSLATKGGYFTKLGILSDAGEDDKDESSENQEEVNSQPEPTMLETHSSTEALSMKTSHSDFKKYFISWKFDELGEEKYMLIQAIKQNSLAQVQEIINKCHERNLGNKAVNEGGESGWNALHWAAYVGHSEIFQELLVYGGDINSEAEDGWTPLQLAVYKNHKPIVEIILKNVHAKVNIVTKKGTALHIAAKNGLTEVAFILLNYGADISIKDKEEILPYEVASNAEIRSLIENQVSKKAKFKPPKPPLIKGIMFKKSNLLLQLVKRYFVMDSNQGTLIRYHTKQDYPDKPKEIIPLNKIQGVRRMHAGLFYDKEFSYIELLCQKRYIFACRNVHVANKWVVYLVQGAIYANYVENLLKEESLRSQDLSQIALTYFDQTSDEIELNDDEPGESLRNIPPSEQNQLLEQNLANHRIEENKGEDDEEFVPRRSAEKKNLRREKVCFESFKILKVLGSGAFGKVYKVEKKDTKKIYAMKALKKRNLILKNHLGYAVTEGNVLKAANHPFVLGLHYSFQTPFYLYFVLDYCPGGDLSFHLANKGCFSEDEVRFFIAELILSVQYLHSKDVIYRDLKPENILIDEYGHIKLADFGLSKVGMTEGRLARSFCGSPAYLSPEMVNRKGVGKAADIYGIGVVMYELLAGESPYFAEDIPTMYQNIKKAKLKPIKGISSKAKSLVTKLLNRNPEKRPGVKNKNDLLKDPFFKGLDWDDILNKRIRPPRLGYSEDDDIEMPMSSAGLFQDVDYNEKNRNINRVKNFTFVSNI